MEADLSPTSDWVPFFKYRTGSGIFSLSGTGLYGIFVTSARQRYRKQLNGGVNMSEDSTM